MTDVWYFADGDTSKGPFSLAELASNLSTLSRPGDVLVWSPGLEGWQRADRVREVAAILFKPPPLQRTVIPPVAPSSTAATNEDVVSDTTAAPPASTERQTSRFTGDPKLTGLGGWLILVGLGQAFGPPKFLASVIQGLEKTDKTSFDRFPVTMYGEQALNGLLFLFMVYTAYLFFTKSRWFPVFFIWEIVLTCLLVVIDSAFVAVTLSMYTGKPIGEFVQALTPEEVGQLMSLVIAGAVWIPYMLKSRRVANTFVR